MFTSCLFSENVVLIYSNAYSSSTSAKNFYVKSHTFRETIAGSSDSVSINTHVNTSQENRSCPGRFIDVRDNRMYSAIKIGNQCWMGENLNIGAIVKSQEKHLDNNTIEKFCFDNNPENCELYGGLYLWDELMAYKTADGKGVCPNGWHVPSDSDWTNLELSLGSVVDTVAEFSWRGTDTGKQLKAGNTSGFEATFAGIRSDDGFYIGISNITIFWTSTTLVEGLAWYRKLDLSHDGVFRHHFTVDNACSVRCIKDK